MPRSPSTRSWIPRCAAILLLGLSACATPEPISPTPDWGWAPAAVPTATFPPLAGWESSGLPESLSDRVTQAGDQLLLGLRIDDPTESSPEIVFLELTCAESRETIQGPRLYWDLVLRDRDGEVIDRESVELVSFPGGVLAAQDSEETSSRMDAVLSASNLVRLVRQTPALRTLLWRVVQKPSLLSLLGGVDVTFGFWPKRIAPTDVRLAGEPVAKMPFRLNINSTEALQATLFATRSTWPFDATNGITALVGTEPGTSNPRSVEIRVLAAR